MSKEVKQLLAQFPSWRVDESHKHIRAYPPKGPFVVMPKTPSDNRSLKNARALMRRIERAYA